MADNITIKNGAGADVVVAAKDITSVFHNKVILTNPSGTELTIEVPSAHDAAVTEKPALVGGIASAAAPTSVSADGDKVQAWHLRNGAQATVITAAGALIGGDATNGLDADVTRLPGNIGAHAYETVAASQTNQVLGPTGATGDYISGILVVPATLSPGNVLLLDNATSITVFAGGTNSVLTLHPFFIPLGMVSVSGSWRLTTGANVSCIGIGKFA
jgi:hypothetical protein